MYKVEIKDTQSQQITHSQKFESEGEANSWISLISSMSPCPWGSSYEVLGPTSCASEDASAAALAFLLSSDWKVIRHRDQLASGISTSLTEQEYLTLLADRQAARSAV